MKKQITKGCNGAGEASGSAMVALPRPPAEPSRYSNIEMQRRFSLRILLTIQVASAILMLILGYLYSPRQRILRAGAELHTNQTFGFDLNGNAWHGVMGERPGKTSAVNAAVFPRNAHFDSAIAESLNRISTIEYLSLEGTRIDVVAVRKLAGNRSLREICLRGTNIGDSEMLALATIPTLECLTVFKSRVTVPGIRRFKTLRSDVNLVNWYR